jgi:hypothetical protein
LKFYLKNPFLWGLFKKRKEKLVNRKKREGAPEGNGDAHMIKARFIQV